MTYFMPHFANFALATCTSKTVRFIPTALLITSLLSSGGSFADEINVQTGGMKKTEIEKFLQNNPITVNESNQPSQDIEAYWTPERRKNAQPFSREKEASNPSPPSDSRATRQKENSPPTKVSDLKTSPYSSAGILYFKKDDGKEYKCTAQFVGRQILLTAAHCIQNPKNGKFYTHFLFIQESFDGKGQDGTNTSTGQLVFNDFSSGNPGDSDEWDFGMLCMAKDSWNNARILLNWGWTDTRLEAMALGYPANYENGQYMYQVTGAVEAPNNGVVQMQNNPLGDGASGGAWIITKLNPARLGVSVDFYAIGLNSFQAASQPDVMYGPYFGQGIPVLYTEAGKHCAQN
jgi:V8-like Glu-specific endopeptidase